MLFIHFISLSCAFRKTNKKKYGDHDGNNARPQNDDEPRADFCVCVSALVDSFGFFVLFFLSLNFCFGTSYLLFLLVLVVLLFFDLWFKCAINQMEMKYTTQQRHTQLKREIRTERETEKEKHEKCIGYIGVSRLFSLICTVLPRFREGSMRMPEL